MAPRGVVKGESVHQGSVESPTAEEQGPGGGTSSVDACEPRFVLSPVGAALLSWAATLVGSAVCNSLWSYSNAGNFVFLHACALFLAWFFAHCTVVRFRASRAPLTSLTSKTSYRAKQSTRARWCAWY